MSYLAELSNVAKTYEQTVALDRINLGVREGENIALLGPNGSGKSTLLRILALIEKPSKGEVHFLGSEITEKNAEELRKETTLVFQKTIVFNTRVYDNIAYGLRLRRLSKEDIRERVSSVLKTVRLEGFENRHAKKLSGGEQQRVALARALALNTKLLLLDEPTANLDPKNASIIEEAIATTNRESKTTVVMATHNMFQAKKLPHHVAFMENGKISKIGPPAEVFGMLSKTFASFAAAENIFTGAARITMDGTTLVDVGNGVEFEMTGQYSGRVSVFISPEDIILSKSHFASSARNSFRGKILEVLHEGSLVRLKVDVGRSMTAQITKRSFNEMKFDLEAEVFLAFKASNVQII